MKEHPKAGVARGCSPRLKNLQRTFVDLLQCMHAVNNQLPGILWRKGQYVTKCIIQRSPGARPIPLDSLGARAIPSKLQFKMNFFCIL